jgi:malonate-semialdehyde dehydrogenase (acetylating) / methylmalonate-semialdehyde dehydrogenase
MAARRGLSRSIPALTQRLPRISRTAFNLHSSMAPANSNPGASAVRRLHATAQQLRPGTTAAASTAESYPINHAEIQNPINTTNFIDNQFVESKATKWIDLYDPATNNLVTRVPQSTDAELKAAVDSAEKAFYSWRETSVLARQQIMFKYVALIRQHWDRLAASITLEQGKTFADAKGDVLRGLQVAETACAIPQQLTGEVLEVAQDMETRQYREPLGVTAAICPFSTLSSPRFTM